MNGFFSDLQPQGTLEELLVEKLAAIQWRYRRLLVTEADHCEAPEYVIDKYWTKEYLLRYEASIERAFDRTLNQLERLRRMRLGEPVPPPIKLEVSSS